MLDWDLDERGKARLLGLHAVEGMVTRNGLVGFRFEFAVHAADGTERIEALQVVTDRLRASEMIEAMTKTVLAASARGARH